MKQFISFVQKEARHILRDRRTMLILFGMPVVLMLLFGFAITTDVRNVRTVVVTSQLSPQNQQAIERLAASEYFTIVATVPTPKDAELLIRHQKADLSLTPSPSPKGEGSSHTKWQIIVDGADPNMAQQWTNYAQSILTQPIEGKYNSRLKYLADVPPGKVFYHFETVDMAEAKKRNIPTNALPETILSEIIDRCYSVSAKKLLLKHGGSRLCAAVCGFIDDGRSDGFLATKGLQDVTRNTLPPKWEDAAPRAYATALRKLPGNEFCKEVFALNNADAETRIEMICASASVPVFFGTFSVKGEAYVDGGWEEKGGDNVPIAPILDNHPQVKTVIVVYLKDERHINPAQRERVRSVAEMKGVRLVEIIPSEDIGGSFGGWEGMFDSSPETARRLIELGRKDACKVFKEMKMTSQEILKGEKK